MINNSCIRVMILVRGRNGNFVHNIQIFFFFFFFFKKFISLSIYYIGHVTFINCPIIIKMVVKLILISIFFFKYKNLKIFLTSKFQLKFLFTLHVILNSLLNTSMFFFSSEKLILLFNNEKKKKDILFPTR